ncbi:MAG: bifunctional phosphopantothenoylcysteine decarboxylase/phosphopantothenate--cysteine ligase CoaBC [Flavobacteriales bacterium]|nr:bifunctional phosphopantothenoylcysteine decarboxylase/phosphopantothenate--cysteine ligase CoaBC [Flavobacteriales bacterium]
MLKGKNVLLGVSGSIAAYKAATICRELIKQGANVKVLMTPDSVNFITPLTLSTLSKNPVNLEYADAKTGSWNNHVELAKWADFFLLAPATQNTLAKMANGICDNLLLATYFSMENKTYFAPAMDLDMFKHPSNQQNIQKLQSNGNVLNPAESGELASGLYGEGRMAAVENILAAITLAPGKLTGKKVLITAGPTYEAIDPVRFIGNHSSGKMGYSLAEEAANRGAEVILISGPTNITPPSISEFVRVQSAQEMFEAVRSREADLFILAAAVADYTVENPASEKIKKKTDTLHIDLKPTVDILHYVGLNKQDGQFVVGFALETNNEEANAIGKLERKKCDLIVLNSLQNKGAGFGGDTNRVTIFDKDNKKTAFKLKTKKEVAQDILDTIEKKWLD